MDKYELSMIIFAAIIVTLLFTLPAHGQDDGCYVQPDGSVVCIGTPVSVTATPTPVQTPVIVPLNRCHVPGAPQTCIWLPLIMVDDVVSGDVQ